MLFACTPRSVGASSRAGRWQARKRAQRLIRFYLQRWRRIQCSLHWKEGNPSGEIGIDLNSFVDIPKDYSHTPEKVLLYLINRGAAVKLLLFREPLVVVQCPEVADNTMAKWARTKLYTPVCEKRCCGYQRTQICIQVSGLSRPASRGWKSKRDWLEQVSFSISNIRQE